MGRWPCSAGAASEVLPQGWLPRRQHVCCLSSWLGMLEAGQRMLEGWVLQAACPPGQRAKLCPQLAARG